MKKIPVSTASTIHGFDITDTFGFVSSHVIAGTNLFSDIFAIFSDTFGGRSKTYKKQLTKIKMEAVQELMEEAIRIGGNAIVGMSIDLDEVSGGGKSMFMITASGTSVKIDNNSASSRPILQNNVEIDSNELDSLIFKAKILASAKNDTLKISEDDFRRIIEDGIFEITDYIITCLNKASSKYIDDFESFKEQTKVYFSLMPKEVAIEKIYSNLIQAGGSETFFLEIIKDNYLFDYQNIKLLLQSEEQYKQKIALKIIGCEKSSYSISDIESQEELIYLIDVNIKPISEIYEVKKLLGTKSVWKCLCESEINAEDRWCSHCRTDIYGFKGNEVSNAKIKLSNRIVGLKIAFPAP